MDGPFKQVFFWNKIGVEDAKKFAFRSSESHLKGASLKSSAISAMDPLDVKAVLAQFLGGIAASVVCRWLVADNHG